MGSFTVIDTKEIKVKAQLEQKRIEQLYLNAFTKQLAPLVGQKAWTENRDNIKRAVFYAVKYFGVARVDRKYNIGQQTYKDVQQDYALLECVKMIMAQLTPREMMDIFPICKTYDGEKWQCKDYFYTMGELENYSMDEPLGDERLEDFLWDYWNDDLFRFSSTTFSIINAIYRIQNGGKGIMEQFAEENGIGTVTVREKEGYMIDNSTGEICKLAKNSKFEVVK